MNFDDELSRGLPAYNGMLGKWWRSKTVDAGHARAYGNIAAYIRESFSKPPGRILDYACGDGKLLFRLNDIFPASHVVGLDGSSYLLSFARRKLERMKSTARNRIALIETSLPNFDFPLPKADLVVFAFPNMLASGEIRCDPHIRQPEIEIARNLAQMSSSQDKGGDTSAERMSLLLGRLVSLHMRHLLKRGGFCLRVEYTRVRREEMSKHELMRAEFEEGCRQGLDRRNQREPFSIVASSYFKSCVIGDVDQQEGKRLQKPGGYMITVLRAV